MDLVSLGISIYLYIISSLLSKIAASIVIVVYTRNMGISSTPPIPPPAFLFFAFSSRSRRAFSRCRTSDTDGRGSAGGSCLSNGGDGSGGTGALDGFEDWGIGVGAVRCVLSRSGLWGGFAEGGFAFGSRLVDFWICDTGVGLVAADGGRDDTCGGGREGIREGASRSSSSVSVSVSDEKSLTA